MADYYTPWGEASGGFDRLGQAAQNVVLGLAQRQAGMARAGYEFEIDKRRLDMERERNREHGALYKAQAALAQADEALTRKKADTTQAGLDLANSFGGTIENLVKAQQGQTPLYAPALEGIAAGQAARLAALGNQHAPENLSQLASFNDPRLRSLMATGTRLPTEIGVNQLPLNYATGLPMQAGVISTPPAYTVTDRGTGEQFVTKDREGNLGQLGNVVGPAFGDAREIDSIIAEMQAEASDVPPELRERQVSANQFKDLVKQVATAQLQRTLERSKPTGTNSVLLTPAQKVARAKELDAQVRKANPSLSDAEVKAEVLKQLR